MAGTIKKLNQYDIIDNYIYFYHLDAYLIIPAYVDSITDAMSSTFNQTSILTRTAPIYSYSNSGPRSMTFQIKLHRDYMNQMNIENAGALEAYKKNFQVKGIYESEQADFVDIFVKYMQASVLPTYGESEKMVNPPIVALRMGQEIFIKGVMKTVTIGRQGPIDRNGRYACVTCDFSIDETTPFDATQVLTMGGFRTVGDNLQRNISI